MLFRSHAAPLPQPGSPICDPADAGGSGDDLQTAARLAPLAGEHRRVLCRLPRRRPAGRAARRRAGPHRAALAARARRLRRRPGRHPLRRPGPLRGRAAAPAHAHLGHPRRHPGDRRLHRVGLFAAQPGRRRIHPPVRHLGGAHRGARHLDAGHPRQPAGRPRAADGQLPRDRRLDRDRRRVGQGQRHPVALHRHRHAQRRTGRHSQQPPDEEPLQRAVQQAPAGAPATAFGQFQCGFVGTAGPGE